MEESAGVSQPTDTEHCVNLPFVTATMKESQGDSLAGRVVALLDDRRGRIVCSPGAMLVIENRASETA
jgi:hypothetical protein